MDLSTVQDANETALQAKSEHAAAIIVSNEEQQLVVERDTFETNITTTSSPMICSGDSCTLNFGSSMFIQGENNQMNSLSPPSVQEDEEIVEMINAVRPRKRRVPDDERSDYDSENTQEPFEVKVGRSLGRGVNETPHFGEEIEYREEEEAEEVESINSDNCLSSDTDEDASDADSQGNLAGFVVPDDVVEFEPEEEKPKDIPVASKEILRSEQPPKHILDDQQATETRSGGRYALRDRSKIRAPEPTLVELEAIALLEADEAADIRAEIKSWAKESGMKDYVLPKEISRNLHALRAERSRLATLLGIPDVDIEESDDEESLSSGSSSESESGEEPEEIEEGEIVELKTKKSKAKLSSSNESEGSEDSDESDEWIYESEEEEEDEDDESYDETDNDDYENDGFPVLVIPSSSSLAAKLPKVAKSQGKNKEDQQQNPTAKSQNKKSTSGKTIVPATKAKTTTTTKSSTTTTAAIPSTNSKAKKGQQLQKTADEPSDLFLETSSSSAMPVSSSSSSASYPQPTQPSPFSFYRPLIDDAEIQRSTRTRSTKLPPRIPQAVSEAYRVIGAQDVEQSKSEEPMKTAPPPTKKLAKKKNANKDVEEINVEKHTELPKETKSKSSASDELKIETQTEAENQQEQFSQTTKAKPGPKPGSKRKPKTPSDSSSSSNSDLKAKEPTLSQENTPNSIQEDAKKTQTGARKKLKIS